MQVRWMEIRAVVIIGGIALLLAAVVAVVVASRNRQQPAPPPDVPVSPCPAEVRVKAVERKPEPMDHEVVEASTAVAIVCGEDAATADRYEARNDADERTWLTDLIQRTAAFSGVKLLAYSVMSNHFHVFVYIGRPEALSDAEIVRRISVALLAL